MGVRKHMTVAMRIILISLNNIRKQPCLSGQCDAVDRGPLFTIRRVYTTIFAVMFDAPPPLSTAGSRFNSAEHTVCTPWR